MKTDFTEVSETRKHLSFEVPPDVVEAEMARVAQGYSRAARIPGFRPGKAPPGVIRQRFRDQILSDVAQDLIARLVGSELKERGLEPVAAPDIRDVRIEEGQPLTFVADFETMPPVDPGEYTGIMLRRPPAVLEVGVVDRALEHLQQRAARWHPVEDRPAARGDSLLVDLTRTRRTSLIEIPGEGPARSPDDTPERADNVAVELGATANPPGFDDQLIGTRAGDTRAFPVTYPADYAVQELAGATVDYDVTVKGIRRKELLPLDDDFAKEVSDVDTLAALRDRVRQDLQQEADREADHKVRHDLLRELAMRVRTVPDSLVDAEVDRRLEEFVRRLMEQGIDPMQANVDWQDFRTRQRDGAAETVRSVMIIDEIARREAIEATDEDVAAEVARFAERAGRTPAAVRARLEKEGALDRIRAGVRREKTMSWLLGQSQVTTV
ncbi:MAG TPA: trigger factor [Vicinamibacterales bacterium]|nr:trigger factor [Vicinamibacterales bacterium]